LAADVDSPKVTTTLKDGVLDLVMPKSEDDDTVFYPGGHGPLAGSEREARVRPASRILLQFPQLRSRETDSISERRTK
jgi:hypothetical protein